jgi:hypothetical protein
MSRFFHHSPFTGTNDEKSGFVLAIPRVANAPAFLPGAATVLGPFGALFWRLREGWIPQRDGKRVDRSLKS